MPSIGINGGSDLVNDHLVGMRPGHAMAKALGEFGATPRSDERLRQARLWVRSRRAFPMTLTEDSAMAAAAMIGDNNRPNTG